MGDGVPIKSPGIAINKPSQFIIAALDHNT